MSHIFIYLNDEETDLELFNFYTSNSKICVVDFSAKWCGPCKKLGETLENLLPSENIYSQIFKEQLTSEQINEETLNISSNIVFLKINVDNFSDLCKIFSVSSIPHINFFKEGKLQEEVIMGNKPFDIINIVKQLLQN